MAATDTSTISCALNIEWLNQQQSVNKTAKWRTATLQLLRNEFREIYLQVDVTGASYKYRLENISVHKKFMSEGKATINFHASRVVLYLSNAPASHLMMFLKTIFIKMSSSKCSPKVPLREQLASNKDRTIQEISPINGKDVNRVKNDITTKIDPKLLEVRKRKMAREGKQVLKKPCISSLSQQLTEEQQIVLKAVSSGNSVFFTGSAGTGKSFLLRHIIASLPPDVTVATASTGAAACLINGTTLHSFAGIGSGEHGLQRCIELARRPQVLQNWKRCKYLIIDEISMVDGKYFEKVEEVARKVRGSDKPFGGIQLIVSGDFLQLPPVDKNATQRFCFQSPAWAVCRFHVYQLNKVYRQSDSIFIDLLNSIRVGKVTKSITETLLATASNTLNQNGIVATRLCCYTQEANTINSSKLATLTGVEKKFQAEDSNPTASKLLDEQTPVDGVIILKVGAQVMLLKNINIAKGLVNGARGIITKFSSDGLPVVQFMSKMECPIRREKFFARTASGAVFCRRQIPLKLAWAFSIHKSQGLTLDCVEMSLSRVFEAGQAYVALSRAKSLDSLRIIDFDSKQVWANPDVLKFYAKQARYPQEYIPLGLKKKTSIAKPKIWVPVQI